MSYKRILTIQDISCVGQCSSTVALPIISACGHETCLLPTAVLSTHTGGFGKPAVQNLTDSLRDFARHWKDNDISFDVILTGYLGTIEAVEVVSDVIDSLLCPDGVCIVDPAMADQGKLYSGLDAAYARAMTELCQRAQIMMPNLTEAAMMAEFDQRELTEESAVREMLAVLKGNDVILTGTDFREGETGFALREKGEVRFFHHPKIGKNYHGTGDMFAAAFAGALASGKDLFDSGRIAAQFVCKAIGYTEENPAHWYGVKFEKVLPDLIKMIQE